MELREGDLKVKSIFDGFKFGMLLQIAVGPVALFIFTEANSKGFLSGMMAVSAVVLVDLVFVVAAIAGVTSFLKSKKRKSLFKHIGFIFLLLFGLNIIINQFHYSILPEYTLSTLPSSSFAKGLFLTGSNPATILFWSGVFTLKVTEDGYCKNEVYLFGCGAVAATLIFLTIIAFGGVIISGFLSGGVIRTLNIIIGFIFILFSIRLIYQ